jgi:hypothetical protein
LGVLLPAVVALGCNQSAVISCPTCGAPPSPATEKTHTSGWDDPPGTGHMFVIDEYKIAESSENGIPGPDGKVHNALAPIGQLGNDQIRQGLLGGETLVLLEIAGVDEPFTGDDDEVTVKFYRGIDADMPFYPANNFMIPMGEKSCCQFLIDIASVEGDPPQAHSRIPAKIVAGQLTDTATGSSARSLEGIAVVPFFGAGSSSAGASLTLAAPRISANVSLDVDSPPPVPKLHDGLLSGAFPILALATTENPYCRTVSDPLCPALIPESTLLDLVTALIQPDIDLDTDGDLDVLKRDVLGNGRVGTCIHLGRDLPPVDSTEPWTGALEPQMGDGYSISFEYEAVGATVVGFGSR